MKARNSIRLAGRDQGEVRRTVQLAMTRNITERRNQELELRRTNAQLAAFLETAALGLHRVGPDGIILWANDAELQMLGYSREEYIGHHISEFHADKPVIDEILKRLACGLKLNEYAARLKCKDGAIKDVLIDSSVLWEDGKFLHTQCFTRDVTEKKRTEEALRESQAQLHGELADSKLLQAISVEIVSEPNMEALHEKLVDAAARVMRSDFASMQMYYPERGSGELRLLALRGFGPEAAETWKWVSRKSPSSCGEAMRRGERVVAADIEQCAFLGADGLAAYRAAGIGSMQSTPLFSRNGELVGMISTHWRTPHEPTERELRLFDILARLAADVIERRRAEMLLRDSKALLESQRDAFQAAMRGGSLEESLEILVRRVIALTGGRGRAAFYIVAPDGKSLHHVIGMNEHYAKCVDGYPVSGESMACGLAVHTGQPVFAPDVEQDPKWEAYRWLARHHNFRACWSFPVRTKDGPIVGTLAMYFPEPCEPTPRESDMATLIAHAATVIISRHQQWAERERAERALQETNERLTKVLEIETVGVMFWDLTTGCLIDANDTFLNMMGYGRADLASRSLTWEKFTPPEYHEISRAEIAKFMESGRVRPYEKEYLHKDGTRRWLLFAGSSLGNNQCVEFCVDVSERKNIEEALRKSERQLAVDAEALARLNSVGSRLWQATTIGQGIDEMLEAIISMLGADMGYIQLLQGDALRIVAQRGFNQDFLDFFREVSTNDESACGRALRGNERIVIHDVTADEAYAPLRDMARAAGYRAVQSTPLTGRDGKLRGVISTHWRSPHQPDERSLRHLDLYVRQAVDFIERCQIDAALRESEERFRTLADNINQLAWMTDNEGWIFWYNRRWFEYTGTTLEQMEGWGWESVHHPDHRERVKALWKNHLSRGAPWEDTFPLRGADGKFRWFLSRAVPIRDGRGQIVRWFGSNTDVTELREAQAHLGDRAMHLEQLVTQRTASLREAVEQMEEFSYSVSHDLRGPLRAMNAYAGVLLEDYGNRLDETGRGYLEKIQRSSDRMHRLTQDVLAYSRVARSQAHPETIDLEHLVRDVIHQHTVLQPPAAEIEIAGPLPPVLGHETTLGQSVSNLLNNAVKFIAHGIKPHVRVWAEQNGKHVRVWFEDNGIGIKPEHQQRIFNMFERVHPDTRYDGTGIGLTIVRKAMEKMGGRVGVQSDGHNGSRFWIELRSPQ